ncbi:TPA: helix-turn-helix domain-containing protein [bacterium]|nr:helix-turn-helix domain-containing protein [bacterium]
MHRNTIRDWLIKYETKGIDGLLEIKPLGRPKGQRSLTDDVLSSLKERLEDPSGFGSYTELWSWLTETHGVSIKYHTFIREFRILETECIRGIAQTYGCVVASITGYSYIVNAMNSLIHNY